jgi:hypothetical protein
LIRQQALVLAAVAYHRAESGAALAVEDWTQPSKRKVGDAAEILLEE